MLKHTKTVCIAVAIAFFLSIGIVCAAIHKPYYSVKEGVGSGKLYTMIIDDETTELELAQKVHLNLFDLTDGQALEFLSPHTQGGGAYYVRNVSQYPIRYTMDVTNENALNVPLSFRLRDEKGDFLAGSETNWVDIEVLQGITGELQSGEQALYALEWIWDSAGDADDTSIGIEACDAAVYSLTVNVQSHPIGVLNDTHTEAPSRDVLPYVLAILLTAVIGFVSYCIFYPDNRILKAFTKSIRKETAK